MCILWFVGVLVGSHKLIFQNLTLKHSTYKLNSPVKQSYGFDLTFASVEIFVGRNTFFCLFVCHEPDRKILKRYVVLILILLLILSTIIAYIIIKILSFHTFYTDGRLKHLDKKSLKYLNKHFYCVLLELYVTAGNLKT